MSKTRKLALALASLSVATQAPAMNPHVADGYYDIMQDTYSVLAANRPCGNYINWVCRPRDW